MTTPTSLPSRTTGSLGVVKANDSPVVDHVFDLDALEWNLAMDWIEDALAPVVGVPVTYAAGSLQSRMDRLTTDDVDEIRVFEHFAGGTALALDAIGGALVTGSTPGGALLCAMDAMVEIGCQGAGYAYALNMLPVAQVRLTMSDVAAGAHCCVGFWDAAGNGWGIEFDKALHNNWRIRVTTGGVSAFGDTGVAATTAQVTLRLWITGTVGAQTVHATVGTTTTTYAGTQAPNQPERPRVYSFGTGPAGATLLVDYVRIEAALP